MGDISKYNQNLKTWRYRLISSLGETLLNRNPVGWDDKQLTLQRDDKYLAVFRSFSSDIEFVVNGGYEQLKELEDTEGILSECELIVDNRNTTTLEDTEVFSAKLDFSEFTESNANKKGIRVPLIDSTFQSKLKNRESIEIPLDRPTDLDNNTIDPVQYTDITLLGREFGGQGNGDIYREPAIPTDPINEYDFSLLANSQAVVSIQWKNVELLPNFQNTTKIGKGTTETLTTDCFYYTNNVTAELSGTIPIRLSSTANTNQTITVYQILFNQDGTYNSTVDVLVSETFQGSLNKDVSFSVNLEERQGLMMQLAAPDPPPVITILEGMNIVLNYKSTFASTPCKLVLPHEAFDYLATSITGEPNSFRSNYFGRTDIGYPEDGEGAYIGITNGLLIRQFPTGYQQLEGEDRKAQLTLTFLNLFETFYKIKNIAIEVIQEDGKYIIVAEKQDDLFTYDEVYEVTSMEKGTFERTRDISKLYSSIEVGYNTNPDDLFGGLEEYINKEYYSTILSNIDNTFDLVSPYSAATVPIEKQRRKPFDATASEEVTGDNNIFLIECIKVDGDIIQRTNEGFTEINGLEGLDTYLNMGLTPKQNLFNHGEELNRGLQKYAVSKIKYNKSDKITDLSFIRDVNEGLIVENGDDNAGRFASPKLTGFLVNFSSPIGFETFIELRNNTKKLIRYTNPISGELNFGWIKEVSTEPVDRPTNWQLFEANPPDVNVLRVLAAQSDQTADKVIVTNNDEMIEIT